MKENKIFPWIVAFSAISISFSAAFYSIFGIGRMFAGASNNVMIMAASLEFAKLVIASFLYRFWGDVNKVLRTYLVIACLLLIMITSAGIYGFLSSAYQETANKVENVDKSTGVLVKQKDMIQKQLNQAEKQLDYKNQRQNTISDIRARQQTNADNLIAQNKSSSSIRTQMGSLGKESAQIDADIRVIQDTITSKNRQITELETQILAVSTNNDLANEIGPLKYIAKLTGKTLDQVVNWFIIALMLVFDPLAISLVIAANYAFSIAGKTKKEEREEEKTTDEAVTVEEETIGEESLNEEIQDEIVDTKNNEEENVIESEEEEVQEEIKIEDAIDQIVLEDEIKKEEKINTESVFSLGTSGISQEGFGGYKVIEPAKKKTNEVVSINNPIRLR